MATCASAFVIPSPLAAALGHMQRTVACPEEVRARIAGLRVPLDDGAGGGAGRIGTNWRSGGGVGGRAGAGAGADEETRDDGFRPARSGGRHRGAPPSLAYGAPAPSTWRPRYGGAPPAPRFGNRALKDVAVEDRMMDRIRDKLNKFSELTYGPTKAWLSQLLDSGETEFLTGFITMVFEKAASEPPICALYARLLTELRAGFPHLDVELRRIFEEFVAIFQEAREEPPLGTADYDAFVAQRARRKYRRGYAAFIGAVAELGALSAGDVQRTAEQMLSGLRDAKVGEGNQGLCEEYADCLTVLIRRTHHLLRSNAPAMVSSVRAAMDRTGAPSLSNKARFALMDLVDLFETT